MSQKITTNLDPTFPASLTPSPETTGKFRIDVQEDIKRKAQQKADQYNTMSAAIPKGLSKEELESRQEEIVNQLNKQNPPKSLTIQKETGKNGNIVAEHKNKLAFIFIGDVKKAEDSTEYTVNAPKISMVVGGGLETTYDPKTGDLIKLDPREDNVIGTSVQLHLLSLADIDVQGILPISTLKNRSAFKTEADIVDLSAKEAVIIRSLGRPYNSSGARILTPGGVHIVSGQNYGDAKIKEPEPMVLGKALNDALFDVTDQISQINSVLTDVVQDILTLKIALMAHVHPVVGPGVTAPSPDLIAQVAPTIASKTVLNITNCYSNLINLELLKTNRMTALSPQKFLSQYNRVN